MSLIDLLEAFFTEYGYVAVFTVLVACGFGIPIPEDVTLVVGGYHGGLGPCQCACDGGCGHCWGVGG